jgi:malate synthase
MEVFDRYLSGPDQFHITQADLSVTAADLLQVPGGTITEAGVASNVGAALNYLASWLCGRGAVPINDLMEDAATAEIARAQLWQWIHHPGGVLEDGRRITKEIFRSKLAAELEQACRAPNQPVAAADCCRTAAELLQDIVESPDFAEFLTLRAYERLP